MHEWTQKKLSEVASLNMGQSPASSDCNESGEGLPFFQGNADFGAKYPSPKKYCTVPKKVAKREDILISVRAPVGDINIALQDAVIGRGLSAITAININRDFLYYYLKFYKPQWLKVQQGSTFESINKNNLMDVEVPTPPLNEQQKIAEILSSVDEAIEKTEAIIKQTETVKKGLMQQLLTKGIGHTEFKHTEIGEVPDSWEIVRLGEIADFINGRGFKPHEWSNTGLPIIRIQNLNGSTDFNYYQGEYNPKILISPGDLLFAWSGSRGTSFGPHIWNQEVGLLNYHTWKVSFNEALIKRDYFYNALKKLTVQIENDSHGASALVHMQKAEIVNYKIALPGEAEQVKIAEMISSVENKFFKEKEKQARLLTLKKALMQTLLTGKVRVNIDQPEVLI